MENQPAAFFLYVGKFGGHEHACRPSKSNQSGTTRILMIRSIDLKGQNVILTYLRVGISRTYWKINKHQKVVFFVIVFEVVWYQITRTWLIFVFIWILIVFGMFLKHGFEPTKICRTSWRCFLGSKLCFIYLKSRFLSIKK